VRRSSLRALATLCIFVLAAAEGWSQPAPRPSFVLPIASSAAPSELDPRLENRAGQALYLPRYNLAAVPVYYPPRRAGEPFSMRRQRRIALRDDASGGALTIYLVRCPVAECPLPPGAGEITAEPERVTLSYGLAGKRIERQFQRLVRTPDGLRARLTMEVPGAFEEVQWALKDKESKPSVTLGYTIRGGVEVEAPEVEKLGREMGYSLGRTPRALDRALQAEDNACWIEYRSPPGTFDAGEVYRRDRCGGYAALRDKENRLNAIRSKFPDAFFEAVDVKAVSLVKPEVFYFDGPDFDYVFRDVDPPGYIRRTLKFRDSEFSYFQEVWRPEVFRYLPDAFKFARVGDLPDFQISYDVPPDAPERARSRLRYKAIPSTNPARIAAAACAFRQFTEDENLRPDLVLLAASGRLEMDQDAGACEVDDSAVALDHAFSGSCVMSMAEFQEVYDRIFSGRPVLQARITVKVAGSAAEVIPFEPRINDLAGTVLRYSPQGSTLWNSVFQPVAAPKAGLDAWDRVGCKGVQLTPPPSREDEIRILPGGSLQVEVKPGPLAPGSRNLDLDWTGVRVLMDMPGISSSLIRPAEGFRREVEVKAATWPADAEAIVVSFLTGPAAVLRKDSQSVTVTLSAPGRYMYKVEVLRTGGRSAPSPWLASDQNTLLAPGTQQ
jgi:hypothetical protein